MFNFLLGKKDWNLSAHVVLAKIFGDITREPTSLNSIIYYVYEPLLDGKDIFFFYKFQILDDFFASFFEIHAKVVNMAAFWAG